jgi:hypothetical protein
VTNTAGFRLAAGCSVTVGLIRIGQHPLMGDCRQHFSVTEAGKALVGPGQVNQQIHEQQEAVCHVN